MAKRIIKDRFDIKRVSYGSKTTPVSKREYKIFLSGKLVGPVGTIKEWKLYCKKNNCKVRIIE